MPHASVRGLRSTSPRGDTLEIPTEYRDRFIEQAQETIGIISDPDFPGVTGYDRAASGELYRFAKSAPGSILIGEADVDEVLRITVYGCVSEAGHDVGGASEGKDDPATRSRLRALMVEVEFWLKAAEWVERGASR